MARWSDTIKHSAESFNDNKKYTTDDQMSIEALNNNIENSLYAIRVAENAQSATNNGVSYNEQTPTTSEQAQARVNINAVSKDASDLSNSNVESWNNKLGITSELILKANKDLANVTYPQAVADGIEHQGAGDRVIESFISSDGKTWYRKWASGWKECGLVFDHSVGTTNKTLPISFNSSNFIITAVAWADTELLMCRTDAVSNSTIKIGFGRANGEHFAVSRARIYCCGY